MRIEKTVLLIDDDKDDLQMLEDALKIIDQDHTTIQAQNGKEALNKLEQLLYEQRLPCLIVLDINMPKMNGKETFAAIKSNERLHEIPIMILSTSSSLSDKSFFERNNIAYLVKPVNFTGLTITASRMINACRTKAGKE